MAENAIADMPMPDVGRQETADAGRGKQSFYRHLILAAHFFAERARAVEQRAVQAPGIRNGDSVRHRSYVTGAILSAAAFLESSINELYLELHSSGARERTRLPKRVLTVLGRFWSDIERAPVLHRYQVVLMVADAERFDERRAPFVEVDTLMKLRDALVYCGPERAESRRRLRRLEQRLRDRFAPNPFAAADSEWFPDQCLGADCAAWAVRATDEFTDTFCRRMSLPARGLALGDAARRQDTQVRLTRSLERDRAAASDFSLPNNTSLSRDGS